MKQKKVDYKDIYDNWDSLPDCKMSLPDETFWGKKLPDGTYGINNVVLNDHYRLQDIVKSPTLPDSAEDATNLILNRRWKGMGYFYYTTPEAFQTKEEKQEFRRKLYEAIAPLGQPGFIWDGLGYLMVEGTKTGEEIWKLVKETLATVGIELVQKGDENV